MIIKRSAVGALAAKAKTHILWSGMLVRYEHDFNKDLRIQFWVAWEAKREILEALQHLFWGTH